MKNKNKKGLILTVSELQAIGCEEKVLASPEQAQRRSLLHDLMVAEDFAPFYGEWWHFSYGDREWAAFYNVEKAMYAQK